MTSDKFTKTLVNDNLFSKAMICDYSGKIYSYSYLSKKEPAVWITNDQVIKALRIFDNPKRKMWDFNKPMNDAGNMSDFTLLFPVEISLYIFGLLDSRDIGRLSRINKKWHELCNSPKIWENLFKYHFPHEDFQSIHQKITDRKLTWKKIFKDSKFERIPTDISIGQNQYFIVKTDNEFIFAKRDSESLVIYNTKALLIIGQSTTQRQGGILIQKAKQVALSLLWNGFYEENKLKK